MVKKLFIEPKNNRKSMTPLLVLSFVFSYPHGYHDASAFSGTKCTGYRRRNKENDTQGIAGEIENDTQGIAGEIENDTQGIAGEIENDSTEK